MSLLTITTTGSAVTTRGVSKRGSEVRSVILEGKVKDGWFVVEKRSSDLYNDFTTSMVELDMIVQKQIFVARDLEDFLWTWNDYYALLIWVGITRDMHMQYFPSKKKCSVNDWTMWLTAE